MFWWPLDYGQTSHTAVTHNIWLITAGATCTSSTFREKKAAYLLSWWFLPHTDRSALYESIVSPWDYSRQGLSWSRQSQIEHNPDPRTEDTLEAIARQSFTE